MYTNSLPPTIYENNDPVEEKKEISEGETSYSSGFLTEACGIVAELENMASRMMSSSLTSPDHHVTVHPLDMDAMNDSLLNSVSPRNSPDKETHLQDTFISPSTPLLAEKKFPENKYEVTASNGNVRMNYTFDSSAKRLNEIVDDTNVEKIIQLHEDKKNFEGTVTPKYEKPKQCLNSTFDHQKTRQCMNTTYDQKGIHPALNSTFDKHLENTAPIPHEGNIANATFIQTGQCVNRTFDGKNAATANPSAQFMNTTFEKEHQTANDTFVSKPLASEAKENDKLNVTFERGEYKISSLNETVNLMDAEGEVLQLILDSTPQKASKRCPEAASTPKCGDKPPQLASKRMLTKDTAQSFLHRISLGVGRDSQSQAHQENKSSSSQDANTRPVIPGLRLGCVDHQAVASQLRRLHSGASSVRSGPMRALPLQSVSGTHSHEKPHDSVGTPDSLEGMKGLPHSNFNSNTGSCIHPGERHAAPSFGSVSSNENERPGTPDIGIITGIGLSTPEVFRSEDPIAGPRITSTPAMRGGVFSCVVGIEGQAPTPITAPPSRSRVVSISSTASLPEGRCNDSLVWQGFSQESVRDSKRTASIPDSSSSGISKEIFPVSKLTPDYLDCGISVGKGEMPKVKRQIVGTGGLCAESVNVQSTYEKICNQEMVSVEPEKSNKDILNQEAVEVGSGIMPKIEIGQTVYSDDASCLKSSIITEGKQNVVGTIIGEHHSKSDANINAHNSGIEMNCHSEFIACDNQEASVYDVGRCHLSGAITEVKEQFITYSESRIDATEGLTTKGKTTNSVESPFISDLDEYQTKAVVLEGQQCSSIVAVEQKSELTGDEKKQIQSSIDKRQQEQSGFENQLAENSSFEKEHMNISNDKVQRMETTVGEHQQVKTTVGVAVNSSVAENQQLGTVVNENELVVTAAGKKQQIDKQKKSCVSEKLKVKTSAFCSQTLQDYSNINRQSKEFKKSHSMDAVKTNQTGGSTKTKNKLKIGKEVSKEINLINRQHSKASGSSKSSLVVLKVSTVSASLDKDKPSDQSSRTRSHTGAKHVQSTSGAQSDPDKNIADSFVAAKMNLGKDVTRKKTNTILRKSISNDGRPLQSSVRSLDKDDKENKIKSTTISSRQNTAQIKSGVLVVHGKKTPFTRTVLGSSNYGARRSLVNHPLALSSEFSAGKVPLKTSTSSRHSKANSVDLKISDELKKAKDFILEPQSASPKFLSAVKQHTDSSLLKHHQSSSGASGKTMLKGKNTVGLKLPVAVHHKPKHTHEQQNSDSNLQGDPATESHIKTKLSRSAGTVPAASRKPSLLRVPKPVVQ
ncbi:uncharacterized protein [Panulirus ornatus]|uniref:uncharacterized protein isoform X2 n=1 Tax=Panulirus ornatus TaxID=150431 RepID=UPI003A8A96D7